MVDHFTAGAFVDDWATPVPLEPAELDRGPLSLVDASCPGPGWELRILPLPSGAILAGETLRFDATVVAPAVMRPFYGWQGDLPACLSEWISVAGAPAGYGGDWQLRGFMLGSSGSDYEDWVSRFQLLTTTLDFGEVQRGSGVARAIEIELQNYYSPAPIEFLTPLPPGVSVLRTLTSTGQTPEMSTTLELWVFFRAALDAPLGTIAPITLELSIDGQPQSVPITASIVAAQTTQMAVALDCSGSMTEDRGDGVTKFAGLKAAFDVLVSVARPGDGIAVAPFSDDALAGHIARSLGDGGAGDIRREAVRTFVDGLSTVNQTSIGDGILSARSLLTSSPDSFSRNALIVITDGVETAPEWIVNVSSSIHEDTFAIGIGTADNVDREILADIAGSHHGYLLLTGDSVTGDNRYRLEKYLLQVLAGVTRDQVVLDPSGSVLPGAVVRIPIPVTEAEFQLDVVVVSSDAPELFLALLGPDGSLRSFEALSLEPGVQIVRRGRVALARVPTPLPLRDGSVWKEGTWQLLIAQRAHVPRDAKNDLLLTHLTQPNGAAAAKAGKVMTYAAVVNARSSLELTAHAHVSEPGKPITLEATLGHCGVPLRGEVTVSARVHTPGGATFDVALAAAQPGRFLGQLEAVTPGVYPTRLRARGYSAAGHPFVRELTLTPALARRASPRNPCNPCERPRSPREKAAGRLAQLCAWLGRIR
jgi:hypothetical protein